MPLRTAALLITLAGGAVAQEEDAPVAGCETLEAEAAGLTDCALVADPLVIAFLYQPAGEGAVLTVTQSDAVDGATQVSAPIGVKGQGSAPQLHDLDADGVDEVFVPVAHVGPETAFIVWRMGDIGFFDPIGEITVTTPSALDGSGDLIRYAGPELDGISTESAYLFDAQSITLIYAVQMDRTAGTCTLKSAPPAFNAAIVLADCEARLEQTQEN